MRHAREMRDGGKTSDTSDRVKKIHQKSESKKPWGLSLSVSVACPKYRQFVWTHTHAHSAHRHDD